MAHIMEDGRYTAKMAVAHYARHIMEAKAPEEEIGIVVGTVLPYINKTIPKPLWFEAATHRRRRRLGWWRGAGSDSSSKIEEHPG